MTTQLIDEATKAELVQDQDQVSPQEEFDGLASMLSDQVILLGTKSGQAIYKAWEIWAKENGYSFHNATFMSDKFSTLVDGVGELLKGLANAHPKHHVDKAFRRDVIGEEDVKEGCCISTAHKSMVWSNKSIASDSARKKACTRARENGTAYILQAIGNGTK